ncbi:T9SS type A sorting domain-containing protein [Hyphobacterium sp. CCMP332]|nr:T9SS type A sorting domain-containing protein [Hyphobacterium sp. CCMP332]
MKRLLLLLLTFSSINLWAQQRKLGVTYGIDKQINRSSQVDLYSAPSGPLNYYLSKRKIIGQTAKSGVSVETLIGHSANLFTSLGDVRNLLSYNPDLDLMTFVHRQDPAEYGNVGNSGWMRYAVSFNAGTSWTENNGLLWDNIGSTASNGRYPQGFIFNPQGNTIADSAYQVWIGPTLTANNGASWGGIGFGSHQIGGPDSISMDQGEFSSNANTKYFIPDGGTFANGKIWALEAVTDATSGSSIYQDTLAIYEGIVQNGILNFTRNAMFFPVDMGPDLPQSLQIAFSPDGQTGYIAGLGRLDSIAYPLRANNLIWMKSTDGGATWSAPAEIYFADDTLITNNIGDSAAALNIASAQFEMDLVVDTFGNPHTLFNIEWRPDNDYGFTYVGLPSTIWHVHSSDGGANWDFNRVFTTQLRYGGIGDGANDAYQQNRPQLSRDPNGRYVMMSYFDTDTTLLINQTPCTGFSSGYCGNSDRYITTGGYNVVKDYYAPIKVWDFFLQGSYLSNFECISEIAPFDGSTITIPYEYMKISDKTNYVSPVDHYYENGVSYTKEEMGDTSAVALSEFQENSKEVKVFPNPSNRELNVLLRNDANASEIVVFNSFGQMVLRTTEFEESKSGTIYRLDVSQLNRGIYLIKAGESGTSIKFLKE